MKVFLYERVSSEEQARHGYSLDAQHEALTAFCEKNNHVVLGVYKDEGISARKPYTKRPAMLRLLDDMKRIKPDIILFTKLDRWFRNIKEYYKVQEFLDQCKVDWQAINEEYNTSTASGRLYVNIKLSIAQDEADRTSERIKDVHQSLIMQGKVLGGRPPIGYKFEDRSIVFADNIGMTREIIDYYTLHQSLNKTCRHINDKYGTNYTNQNLRRLLTNPVLKGEYKGNVNFCKALITSEEYDKLQKILANNVKFGSKKHTHIFAGLIICPCCNTKMAGCYNGYHKYYRCNKALVHTCDFHKHISELKVEKWLLENIEEDFKIHVEMQSKATKENPKKYRDRLKRLNDMYLLGNIDEEEYRRTSAAIQRKIADLEKVAPAKTETLTAGWREVYEMLDKEHKRSFWRGLISGIRFNEDREIIEVVY